MNKFSIKDIENLTGIKAHTIRIWEQRYGILQPKRTTTNIRYYDALDLKLALRISLLNRHGYKISRIHKMTALEMNALIQKINDKDFRLHLMVSELLETTFAMDVETFESILSNYIRKHGMEETIEQLIFHFLEKIGLMWMTDRIFPAQEHLVSNIIYRKLAVAIENLPPKNPDSQPAILLFLPEGEIHDLGLLYVNYLMLKMGKNPVYLGANSPIEEASLVHNVKKFKYIYVHLTSAMENFDGNKYLQRLSNTFTDCNILISGGMLRHRKFTPPNNIKFLHSLTDVRNEISLL